MLQAVGLVQQKGDFGGLFLELAVVIFGDGQRGRNVAVGQVHVDKGLRLGARDAVDVHVRVATGQVLGAGMAAFAGEILLEAVGAATGAVARAVAGGVGVPPLEGGPLLGVGGLRAVAGLGVVRAGIVVGAPGRQLLVAGIGIALGLDLCLALAVGGFGLFEDVDNVLALDGGEGGWLAEKGREGFLIARRLI